MIENRITPACPYILPSARRRSGMAARQVRRSVVIRNLQIRLLAMDSDRTPLGKGKDVLHGAAHAAPLRQSVEQPWDGGERTTISKSALGERPDRASAANAFLAGTRFFAPVWIRCSRTATPYLVDVIRLRVAWAREETSRKFAGCLTAIGFARGGRKKDRLMR